jgi:hypothetical protein
VNNGGGAPGYSKGGGHMRLVEWHVQQLRGSTLLALFRNKPVLVLSGDLVNFDT